jgi:t-SNARE complex subunit (syntaxin)
LVESQGTHLDIIGEELFAIRKNVGDAHKQLHEASKIQKKSRKKYLCICFMMLLIVGGAMIFTFVIK